MNFAPKIGTTGETTFVVAKKHCIEFTADGMPVVLSPSHRSGILEGTARHPIAPFPAADECSTGAKIERRAGPELMAHRVHKRAVVRTGSFSQRGQNKVS